MDNEQLLQLCEKCDFSQIQESQFTGLGEQEVNGVDKEQV